MTYKKLKCSQFAIAWAGGRWGGAWYLLLDHWLENYRSAKNRGAGFALVLFWLVFLALLFPKLVLCKNTWTTKDRVILFLGGYDWEVIDRCLAEIKSAIWLSIQSSSNDSFISLKKWTGILAIAVNTVILVETECVPWVRAETAHISSDHDLSLRDDASARAFARI